MGCAILGRICNRKERGVQEKQREWKNALVSDHFFLLEFINCVGNGKDFREKAGRSVAERHYRIHQCFTNCPKAIA